MSDSVAKLKIQWTQTAFEKLAIIKARIASEQNPAHARRWVESAYSAANRLLQFPHLGVELAETGPDATSRVIPLGNYRMIYRVDGSGEIQILEFTHAPQPDYQVAETIYDRPSGAETRNAMTG